MAIKVLSTEIESMRGEREFIAELSALSVIRHENLVRLRGCCVDGAGRYLVYDYMDNNSLTHTLLGKPMLLISKFDYLNDPHFNYWYFNWLILGDFVIFLKQIIDSYNECK